MAQLAQGRPRAKFCWVTLSADGPRADETRAAAARLLAPAVDLVVRVESFRGSYFPVEQAAIKDCVETLKAFRPDLILTHTRGDLHQDHRVVNELTWNTFRNHLILEYEIPKFDADLGQPNLFVPLTREQLAAKIEVLMTCFPSQRARSWFTPETFQALARIRGIECAAPEGFAEAFYLRKGQFRFDAAA